MEASERIAEFLKEFPGEPDLESIEVLMEAHAAEAQFIKKATDIANKHLSGELSKAQERIAELELSRSIVDAGYDNLRFKLGMESVAKRTDGTPALDAIRAEPCPSCSENWDRATEWRKELWKERFRANRAEKRVKELESETRRS